MYGYIQSLVYDCILNFSRLFIGFKKYSLLLHDLHITYMDTQPESQQAPPIVFIHGLGGDKDAWLSLAQQLKHRRLIAIDLPGHGDSDKQIDNDYSIESQAQAVLSLCEKLGIHTAHFIGNSMGSATTLKIAYLKPKLCTSIVLINSYGVIQTPSHVENMIEKTGRNPMLDIQNVEDYKNMLSLAMNHAPQLPGFVLKILSQRAKAQAVLYHKILEDSGREEFVSILPDIKVPTLVLWGAKDKILHPDNAKLFVNAIPNATYKVIEDAGHVPMVEKPKIVASLIKKIGHI